MTELQKLLRDLEAHFDGTDSPMLLRILRAQDAISAIRREALQEASAEAEADGLIVDGSTNIPLKVAAAIRALIEKENA